MLRQYEFWGSHPSWQTSNLIINLDHDDWILNDDNCLLAELGFGQLVFFFVLLFINKDKNPCCWPHTNRE